MYTLITGASGGLGEEFARLFAKDHHNLILVARSAHKLEALKDELMAAHHIDVRVIPMDLSVSGSAQTLFDKTEHYEVDTLVNNAGFGDCGLFLDSDLNKMQQMMQLNMVTLTEMCYLYGNAMKKAGSGRILNIASVAGMVPGPYMSVYYATKSYVLSLSQALNEEFAKDHIQVTVLNPGPTATNFATAANSGKTNAFKPLVTAKADECAKKGYEGLKAGKAVVNHSIVTHATNAGLRVLPRSTMVHILSYMNKSRD